MDIFDKLQRMSQWLWVSEVDLERNAIAREAATEIYFLRCKIDKYELALGLIENYGYPSKHLPKESLATWLDEIVDIARVALEKGVQ